MLNLELSWPQAAVTSGCLFVAAAAAKASARPRLKPVAAIGTEAGLLLGLFALWQLAGSFAVFSPGGALPRAQWIWHAERVMHLPSEASLQAVFLPHPLLIQLCNLYYLSLHFPVLLVCLLWLFLWHRDHYGHVRTTIVIFTAVSLLIQFLPVAPPRMLASDHMVDTAVRYGQSVYGTGTGFDPDQLSAMPSVHVGWAIIVAMATITVCRSRWRWLALAYPALTMLVVVVTANHFWLDGIAAAVLVALVHAAQHGLRVRFGRRPVSREYGEAVAASAVAAAGAEARQAAPPWHQPQHEPRGRPAPESGQRVSGSR
jgi:MFS superfamily sulfate permease-like transporter